MKAYCKNCVVEMNRTIQRGHDHDMVFLKCYTCSIEVRLEF